ncbi:MAG: lipid-A-disaccharide synthase N-terminal domain-containing protein [Thermoanaerobaculia bacterium]
MTVGGSDGLLAPFLSGVAPWLYADSAWWTAIGLLGNGIFSSRFIIQWLASEKRKAVHVPPLFWHLSFWGSVLSLLYAIHIDKLPIILSFAFLPFLYGRNLALLRRGANAEPAPQG